MEGDTLTTWGYGAVNTQGIGYEAFADPWATWGYAFIIHEITELNLFKSQIKSLKEKQQVKSLQDMKQIKFFG